MATIIRPAEAQRDADIAAARGSESGCRADGRRSGQAHHAGGRRQGHGDPRHRLWPTPTPSRLAVSPRLRRRLPPLVNRVSPKPTSPERVARPTPMPHGPTAWPTPKPHAPSASPRAMRWKPRAWPRRRRSTLAPRRWPPTRKRSPCRPIAANWPEIVRDAATAFANVQNFTVLDGATGVNRALDGGRLVGHGRVRVLPRPVRTEGRSPARMAPPHGGDRRAQAHRWGHQWLSSR